MHEVVFALQFTGRAGPVPGTTGKRQARTTAGSQVLRTILTRDSIEATVHAVGPSTATLESAVEATGDGRFTESGTITYGTVGTLQFETIGDGIAGVSAAAGIRHGAVIWRITGGDGKFAGATGLITSNFAVTDDGRVTDNHFVRLYLH